MANVPTLMKVEVYEGENLTLFLKSFNILPAAIRRWDAADVRYLLKIHSQMFLTAKVCKLPFASRSPPLPAAVLLNFKYLQSSVAPQCSSGLNGGPALALCSPAAPHPSNIRGAFTGSIFERLCGGSWDLLPPSNSGPPSNRTLQLLVGLCAAQHRNYSTVSQLGLFSLSRSRLQLNTCSHPVVALSATHTAQPSAHLGAELNG